MQKLEELKEQFSSKLERRGNVYYYLPKISNFQQEEIKFHDAIASAEEEAHQLRALRNRYYHAYFKQFLLPYKNGVLLEIGAGTGSDLFDLVNNGCQIVAVDISPKSLNGINNKLLKENQDLQKNVLLLAADGQNLPLEDNAVASSFLVATLHHFENQNKVLKEIARVTDLGGLIVCAMEPSCFMMWFTKLFKNNSALRIHQGHSEADETHVGYNLANFKKIAQDCNLKLIKIKRIWLLQGFLHYGLEAIYRIFKLKNRIKIPAFIEIIFLALDEFLLYIPLLNKLNWHWIAIYKKSN